MELYTLDTRDVISRGSSDEKEVTRFFWYPNPLIVQALTRYLLQCGVSDKVIDVGAGSSHFPPATHLLDFNDVNEYPNKVSFKLDLDFERFPYDTGFFNFLYCRHTLEDIQNPQFAFSELVRVSKAGYVETPSPLAELTRGVDALGAHRGYHHHRYIVWTEAATNTLFFLPKYPLIETGDMEGFEEVDREVRGLVHLLNNYPVYWNNYYTWTGVQEAKCVVYRNGINMLIRKDYCRLLREAIRSSIDCTDRLMVGLRGGL